MTHTPSALTERRRTHRRRPPAPRHWGSSLAVIALAPPIGSPSRRFVTNALLVTGSALVAISALIHLYLWADGYRHIPTIGPLFVWQGIVGMTLAVALVAYPRVTLAVVGAAFLLATIAGLLLSATAGLFGFMDHLDAPWANTSLVVESVGAALLLLGAVLPLGATRTSD